MTVGEFELWLLCHIAIYHHAPRSALGGVCPAQMWERDASKHSPLLPVSVDSGELCRQFLPSKSPTVHAKGIQIRYRHYWHPMLAARIGQRVEISWDERTIQHIYADLDGRYVELPVVGDYPDVWEADWEAARAGVRALGRAYQADGGRAATARAVAAANQEIHRARVRTKAARRQAKRREGEGTTLADLRYGEAPEKPPIDWKPGAELSEDDWLQERTWAPLRPRHRWRPPSGSISKKRGTRSRRSSMSRMTIPRNARPASCSPDSPAWAKPRSCAKRSAALPKPFPSPPIGARRAISPCCARSFPRVLPRSKSNPPSPGNRAGRSARTRTKPPKIGRASCRERGCHDV